MTGSEFLRRFRWLIFHAWNIPPVFGLGFILQIGVLTPGQMAGILLTPLEPAYILGWLAFAVWHLPRRMRPLAAWLDGAPGTTPEAALDALRSFPLQFWATFLVYLVLAPVSVVLAAYLFTDYSPTVLDLFRIELVALIVSIIVGLPIFFLVLDLFGRTVGSVDMDRPMVTIRPRSSSSAPWYRCSSTPCWSSTTGLAPDTSPRKPSACGWCWNCWPSVAA